MKMKPTKKSNELQEFEAARQQLEQRYHQLEAEVHKCHRQLRNERDEVTFTETDEQLAWQYDMSEFPCANIGLQLKKKLLRLHAHRKDSDGLYTEINREIVLPEDVDQSMLSANLNRKGLLTITVPLKQAHKVQLRRQT